LLVGSEGTLALTLEAKLRLVELPRARGLLVVSFDHLLEALAATPLILGHHPSAVEVVDKYVLDSTRSNAEASRLRDFLVGDPGAILLIEFFGEAAELPARMDTLAAELRAEQHGSHIHMALEPAAQARIWKLRKMALGLSMAQKGDAKAISFVEDTAVAPEKLRDYIAEFLEIVRLHGTTAGVYAHASVGCLHVRPVIDLKTAEGVQRFASIAAEVADLVAKYGGALSGEHGDGLVRSPFQEKMFGPELYEAFREIKRTFDPQNLLNPGKIVDAPPLVDNLRYGPEYVTPEIPTVFDFSADGSIVRATELCSGVGACRKKRDGVMCPSYQATREEQHSTRGRADALRLALTGQLDLQGLTDPVLWEAFDLCLECKACKTECPTNVDMARLKAEFLHQYFQRHGVPLRNRVFGRVASLSRWGRPIRPIFNWWNRGSIGRWFNDLVLGIDRRRIPPGLARRTLLEKLRATDPGQGPGDTKRQVLLFPDTFTNYFEPAIGLAAIRVLRHLGCDVSLDVPESDGVDLGCCGRPLISNGLLGEAVQLARHNVQRLYPWLSAGERTIIACEPSCILTIKDDYPALLRGEERRQAGVVAAACSTFEEYVEFVIGTRKGEDASASHPAFALAASRTALVHTHCHQRSLIGAEPTLRLLGRIPGLRVVDMDAGCCGMAGSFGYETEHYEISRLVGEQRLLPTVRNAAAGTLIVASGFSCRSQIAHFTGRRAVHPAELLATSLGMAKDSGTLSE
jgi:Fe-S oxidoreductase